MKLIRKHKEYYLKIFEEIIESKPKCAIWQIEVLVTEMNKRLQQQMRINFHQLSFIIRIQKVYVVFRKYAGHGGDRVRYVFVRKKGSLEIYI